MMKQTEWKLKVNVTIYIRDHCHFCDRAVALLHEKNVVFEVINAGADEGLKAQMIEKSGRRTFPQIFIGDKPVGGCDDLLRLEKTGQLDILLRGEAS